VISSAISDLPAEARTELIDFMDSHRRDAGVRADTPFTAALSARLDTVRQSETSQLEHNFAIDEQR